MPNELVDALKSAPAAYAAGIAVAAAILKSGKALLQFHDDYIRTRPFKRLSYLAGQCSESDSLSKVIVEAKRELVFREIFNASGSPLFIDAMVRLLDSRVFSFAELRVVSFYLRLRDDEIVVELGLLSRILFWVPLMLVLAMGLYLGLIIATLLATKSFTGLAVAGLFLALFVLFAWFVGSDSRAVYVARSVEKRLKAARSLS